MLKIVEMGVLFQPTWKLLESQREISSQFSHRTVAGRDFVDRLSLSHH